ncbi:hypothetical protein ACLWBD_09725 [Bdellovibrio sp. HCB117]|uniref:hypothetical protein n=1 Tax=Bdellovibrio sp. HCB117 TaxID=3394359 RepID=UPI0039B66B01
MSMMQIMIQIYFRLTIVRNENVRRCGKYNMRSAPEDASFTLRRKPKKPISRCFDVDRWQKNDEGSTDLHYETEISEMIFVIYWAEDIKNFAFHSIFDCALVILLDLKVSGLK